MEEGKEQMKMIHWIQDLWSLPRRIKIIESELRWLNDYLKSNDPNFFNPLRYLGEFKWKNINPEIPKIQQLEQALIKESSRLTRDINLFLKIPKENPFYKRQGGKISSKDFCIQDLALLGPDDLRLKLERIIKGLKSRVKFQHKQKKLRIVNSTYINIRSTRQNPNQLIGRFEVFF